MSNYHTEERVINGQSVMVKVYPTSRRNVPQQVMKVRGTEQRGALHVAKENGKVLNGRV